MNLDNPIVLIPLLTGPFFILAGIILFYFPPKKINNWYGYRTPRSKKSQKRWDFAQKYSAKELIKWGTLLSLTSTLGFLYDPTEGVGTIIGLGLMISFVIITIVRVEKAIKEKFSNS